MPARDVSVQGGSETGEEGRAVMANQMSALLDAFAEVRRTWDELVGLQPDIVSASGPLSDADLALLSERVSAPSCGGRGIGRSN